MADDNAGADKQDRSKEVVLNVDGASEVSHKKPSAGDKPRVLVCEDSTLIRKMITKLLQSNGFEVIDVAAGQMALNRIYDSAEAPFSLMIFDLMLPDISGLEIVAHLRKNPTVPIPPIIVCSARRERQVILTASKLGIAGYIAKPFKTEDFMNKIRIVMESARVAEASGATAPAGAGSKASSQEASQELTQEPAAGVPEGEG